MDAFTQLVHNGQNATQGQYLREVQLLGQLA